MPKRPAIPLPTVDDFAGDQALILVHILDPQLDDLNRARLDAFWLDAACPTGVRGQVFFTVLPEFIARDTQRGLEVRGVDDHSQRLIDSAA